MVTTQGQGPGLLGSLLKPYLRGFPTLAMHRPSHQPSAVHLEPQGWGVISKRGSIKDVKCFAHREVHRYVGEPYITLKWHAVWFGVGRKIF